MKLLISLALVAVCALSLAGCPQDGEESTTASNDEASSGGEDTWGDEQEGQEEERSRARTPRRTDRGDTARTGGTDDGSNGNETGVAPSEPGNSPWGETRAEQCRPPPRRNVSERAQAAITAGIRSGRRGDSRAAQADFERALSADSGAYPAAYNLGVLADRSGNETRAIEWYRRALQGQADYAPALQGIATIHIRRGQINEAVAAVEPVARRFPTSLQLQAVYAETLVRAERYGQAWEAARRALRCDERSVPAMIAIIKASLGEGRDTLAERVLEQALEIDAENAELHFLRSRFLLNEPGRLNEVLAELRRAVQLRPDYAEAHIALGEQLLAGANYAEALRHFQTAVRLAPNVAGSHVGLGNAQRALQQWTEAKASFDRALQLNSNLPEVHYNLGLLYMTAAENFPGLDNVSAFQRAVEEFTRYRNMMGSRLPREDDSEGYLRSLSRQIEREQRRIERERAAAERGTREGGEGE